MSKRLYSVITIQNSIKSKSSFTGKDGTQYEVKYLRA